MPTNPKIRLYRDADDDAVKALIVGLQAHERQFEPRMSAPEDIQDTYFAYIRSRCAKETGEILVAETGGDIVGFVCVLARVVADDIDEDRYEYAYVSDLVVAPDHRGAGVGSALLAEAETFARAHGAKWLRIGVLAGNEGAIKLYRRAGFVDRAVQLEKPLTEKG